MRLKLTLKAHDSLDQPTFMRSYPVAMNSLIYNSLAQYPQYQKLHNEKNYKGFCFGNLFPVRDEMIKANTTYSIIISSIQPDLLNALIAQFYPDTEIRIGGVRFRIVEAAINKPSLQDQDRIETISMINITRQENGSIKPILYNQEPENFLQQLSSNLIKKCHRFLQEVDPSLYAFRNVQCSLIGKKAKYTQPLLFHNTRFTVIGNKLAFTLRGVTEDELAVLRCGFEAGFGERNCYGMGFMVKNTRNSQSGPYHDDNGFHSTDPSNT